MTDVLDLGKVELVDSMGDDTTVSNSARILFENWRGEADEKLISYMLKHKHFSPFEHVAFTFYIKAPIFVMRQWMRHRTWSFNEVSGRYKELPAEYYIPAKDKIGVQSTKNHQSRDVTSNNLDAALIRYVIAYQANVAFGEYQYLLEIGCPREVARMILPLNTYTELVATVKLRNLLEFFELRSSPDAQYEIQVYSDAMKALIKPIVPVTISKWEELQK